MNMWKVEGCTKFRHLSKLRVPVHSVHFLESQGMCVCVCVCERERERERCRREGGRELLIHTTTVYMHMTTKPPLSQNSFLCTKSYVYMFTGDYPISMLLTRSNVVWLFEASVVGEVMGGDALLVMCATDGRHMAATLAPRSHTHTHFYTCTHTIN